MTAASPPRLRPRPIAADLSVVQTSQLTREQTLAALLPLVDTTVWVSTYVGDAIVSAFADTLRRVHVRPAPYTGVEEARLDFGNLAAAGLSAP